LAALVKLPNLPVVLGLFEFAPVAAFLLEIGRLFALAARGVLVQFLQRLPLALVQRPLRLFGFGLRFAQRALLIRLPL